MAKSKCPGGVCNMPSKQSIKAQRNQVKMQGRQNKVDAKQMAVQNEATRNAALNAPGPRYADSPIYQIPPKKSIMKGTKPWTENVPLQTEAQGNYLDSALKQATEMLQNPQNTSAYKGAQDYFRDTVTPTLANRFGVLGSGQHQRASGMNNALAGAGNNLSQRLPGIIQGMAQQLGEQGLTPRYAQQQHAAKPGMWHAISGMFGGKGADAMLDAGLGYSTGFPQLQQQRDQSTQMLMGLLGTFLGGGMGGAMGGGMGGGMSLLGNFAGGNIGRRSFGGGGGDNQQGQGELLNEEALQQLIQALVGNQDIKKTLMAGG